MAACIEETAPYHARGLAPRARTRDNFRAVALLEGTIIGEKYRIIRLIDERGVGAVYEGRRLRGDGRVAIKVLRRKFSADSEWIARFERETMVVARMASARLARFLDVGVLPDRRRFMVME